MKTTRHTPSSRRGSTILIVVIFTTILALLASSVIAWSLTERRINKRHALYLETRNAAEGASEYVVSQLRHRMENQTSFSSSAFSSSGSTPISAPPAALFTGGNIQPSAIEVIAGPATVVSDPNLSTYYFDPNNPANQFDPMKNKHVFRRNVEVLAKATGTIPGLGSVTTHVMQTLSVRDAPLFSHAIFYNMDLELAPGLDMTIYGPVHTNGNLWVVGQASNSSSLDFAGPVTVSKGLYWGYEIAPTMGNGQKESVTQEAIRFSNQNGTLINLNANGTWRDQKMGANSETPATADAFRSFSSSTYNGYLTTGLHGVQNYNPVAFGDYVKDPTPNNGVDNSVNTGRAIIERPLLSSEPGYNAEVENQKYARKSGLYIAVNPSSVARTAKKPNGTTVSIPAQSYKAFKANGTEVKLPGSPNHSVTTGRPVIQIKQDQMKDLRRFEPSFNYNANRSNSNRYVPKNLDIIEFDMTAFKMAVDYTVNNVTSTRIYDYDSPGTDSTYKATSTTSKLLNSANRIENFAASDWNGSVYIESVDAELRKDSGVRIINARGPVAGTPARSVNEGLTLATNDALYVLGHFNADGSIDTGSTSSGNSSRYPESDTEIPAALAADAITILSQPTFSGGEQNGGWNDALSAHRTSSSSSTWSSTWDRTPPSSSNQREGINTTIRPATSPTSKTPSTSNSIDQRSIKFYAQNTEIASALLTGVVPSNKDGSDQHSGGAHNFPRLLEHWATPSGSTQTTLAIRGSMVALFESRIATEPWSIRYYNAPERFWGFNNMFADGRYPPQTPLVRTFSRVNFRDINAAEYAARVTAIGWSPTTP